MASTPCGTEASATPTATSSASATCSCGQSGGGIIRTTTSDTQRRLLIDARRPDARRESARRCSRPGLCHACCRHSLWGSSRSRRARACRNGDACGHDARVHDARVHDARIHFLLQEQEEGPQAGSVHRPVQLLQHGHRMPQRRRLPVYSRRPCGKGVGGSRWRRECGGGGARERGGQAVARHGSAQ